eukprot:6057220-Prymnesium_polylepis.1
MGAATHQPGAAVAGLDPILGSMLRSRVRRTAAVLAAAPFRRCAAVLLLSRARGLLCACPATVLDF